MNREEKIEQWFYEYVDDIYNFLIYYTGKKDVEDLVQDVFIKVLQTNNSENIDHPKTYLFAIARNTAIDYFRKRGVIQWVSDEILNKVSSNESSPEESLLLLEDYNVLLNNIQQLKRSYRDVLVLKLINDLTFEEISVSLNWHLSKVKTTYYRAIQKLKQKMPIQEEVQVK